MGVLDGFVPFDFNAGYPYVSVTSNGLTFNKSVTVKMNYPEYVLLLINEDKKQIALRSCDESENGAVAFYKRRASGILSVRWNSKDLTSTVESLMGWDLSHDSYRIDGTLVKSERVMIFDLNCAKKM